MPAIGISPPGQGRQNRTPRWRSTRAAASRGECRARRSRVSSQSRRWISKIIVRAALVASVMCTLPPVSFHTSQESTVPNRISPRSAFSRAPSTWSSSHLIFVPEKYASGTRPVVRADVLGQTVPHQPVHNIRGAAALPDDSVVRSAVRYFYPTGWSSRADW